MNYNTVYVGMDVHKESFTLCAFTIEADKGKYHQKTEPDLKKVLKYLEFLRSIYGDDAKFVCGYEAGCLGYTLYHQLTSHDVDCKILAPPRLRCTLFPLIYPPHLLVLPATFGLYLHLQTYPYFRAFYVISVRRTKSLPTASFRFHLTTDTLAVQLYTSSLPRRVRDFHPLERAHGAQTNRHIIMRLHAQTFWNGSQH